MVHQCPGADSALADAGSIAESPPSSVRRRRFVFLQFEATRPPRVSSSVYLHASEGELPEAAQEGLGRQDGRLERRRGTWTLAKGSSRQVGPRRRCSNPLASTNVPDVFLVIAGDQAQSY